MSLESKIHYLQDRALCFQKARSFFLERNVLEVDTPLLSHSAPIDEHIDIMKVDLEGQYAYLHSSPEYAMKRLLSLGIGDIFQMSHVFRLGEVGSFHNPEFTMVEWYRTKGTFSAFIEETVDFTRLFLGNIPYSILTYREALLRFARIDYVHASEETLISCAESHQINFSRQSSWDKDSLLHLLMSHVVEPHLGQQEILVLTDYPASQAALAKTEQKQEELVAKRFEIYYKGIELANGYFELTNSREQRARLLESNQKRISLGKEALPLDEHFLKALEKGLPECFGVAVGFDRLLMLKHKAPSLKKILPLDWSIV